MEIFDRMYPDRNWRVFLYDFPGNGKKTGDSGNSEEHSGRIEGCMIKRSEFRKIRWRLFGKQYGQTKELSWMYI